MVKKKINNYLTKLKKKVIKKAIKTSFIKKKVNEQLILLFHLFYDI